MLIVIKQEKEMKTLKNKQISDDMSIGPKFNFEKYYLLKSIIVKYYLLYFIYHNVINTIQYNTIQYNTIQYNTIQCYL